MRGEIGRLDVQDANHPVLAKVHVDTLAPLSRETTEVELDSSVRAESPVGATLESESTRQEQYFDSLDDIHRRVSSASANDSSTTGSGYSNGNLEGHANSPGRTCSITEIEMHSHETTIAHS